jgi:hypothetical protein
LGIEFEIVVPREEIGVDKLVGWQSQHLGEGTDYEWIGEWI